MSGGTSTRIGAGWLVVAGLGPGADGGVTPEVTAALSEYPQSNGRRTA